MQTNLATGDVRVLDQTLGETMEPHPPPPPVLPRPASTAKMPVPNVAATTQMAHSQAVFVVTCALVGVGACLICCVVLAISRCSHAVTSDQTKATEHSALLVSGVGKMAAASGRNGADVAVSTPS